MYLKNFIKGILRMKSSSELNIGLRFQKGF